MVTATDARTVTLKFGVPYGPGVRVLDELPIMPEHKLEAAVKSGRLLPWWDVHAARRVSASDTSPGG